MSAEEVARVLSPERLSGLVPVTGVIDLRTSTTTADRPSTRDECRSDMT